MNKKPTITELEAILEEKDVKIEILPNGEVRVNETKWQPIQTAPKDGTWILLRGKNSIGRPMIPVVVAWTFGHTLAETPCWRDSASLRDMTDLAASPDGAEWRYIEHQPPPPL